MSAKRSVAAGLVAMLGVVAPAHAAEGDDASELQLFQLDDVLNQQVSVASNKATALRETPGVVSVISREQIIGSGARDLIDVLAQVPGFWFGTDVEGVVDVGFRGVWGHEGKTLLLIDGIEMNELLYSTLQLGAHYPLDEIDRIEVIRGPGSVQYGGDAELAVINVITRSAAELHGAAARGSGSTMAHVRGGNGTVALGIPAEVLHGPSITAAVTLGRESRSDRSFADFYGSTYSMADASAMDTAFVNVGLEWKGFKARFLYDGYSAEQRDNYGQNIATPVRERFPGLYADARYDWKLGKLTVTPRVSFTRQSPWGVDDVTSDQFFSTKVQRLRARLTAHYDFTDSLNLTAGGEVAHDHAWVDLSQGIVGTNVLFGDSTTIGYDNLAAYGEVTWQGRYGNLTAGARWEHHSEFGDSFVPRVAYTKVFDRFHLKALASRAFRAPSVEDINNGKNVKPEHTTVFEVEAGYKLTDHVFVSANAFDVTISNPIIYFDDAATLTDYYLNFGKTGSRGAEMTWHFQGSSWSADATYSFNTASGKNNVPLYQVDGHPGLLLGMPAHKVTASATFPIWRELRVAPSLVVVSNRYGYLSGDGLGDGTLASEPAQAIANLYLSYSNAGMKGLTVGAGVFNLFDANVRFIQPYNSGHAPLPAQSREFILRLSYDASIW